MIKLKKLTDLEIGQIIKRRRLELGLTQTQLGEKLGVGAGAVNKWEQGKVTNIKRDVLRNLTLELQIPTALLIGLGSVKDLLLFGTEEFSQEEITEIINFVEYIKSKRKRSQSNNQTVSVELQNYQAKDGDLTGSE